MADKGKPELYEDAKASEAARRERVTSGLRYEEHPIADRQDGDKVERNGRRYRGADEPESNWLRAPHWRVREIDEQVSARRYSGRNVRETHQAGSSVSRSQARPRG